MRVSLVCFGAMRDYLPEDADGNRASVVVGDDATVGDLVDAIGAPRRLVHALLVDEVQAELSTALREGSTVTLMPPFGGGSGD